MGGVGSAFPVTDIPIISTVPDLLAFLDELHYRTRYELGEDWVGSLFMDIQASDIDRITSVLTNYFDPLRRVPTFNNICFFRNATSGTTPITFHLINTADIFRNDIYSKIIVSPSPFHHQICADSPVGKDILRAVPTEETFINLKHRVLLVASPGRSGTPLVVPILTPPSGPTYLARSSVAKFLRTLSLPSPLGTKPTKLTHLPLQLGLTFVTGVFRGTNATPGITAMPGN